MIDEYRRSLKMPEAEEIFDLILYRPFAFVFVKAVYRTRLTPNQVTLISMLFGLAAAYHFSFGTPDFLMFGALLYAIANILDCADGQLARLQQSGTLFGRVVDGFADYVSSMAIFIGVGLGLAAAHHGMWWLIVAVGLSSALHAMFFDHYQSEFISAVRSERNFLEAELEQFRAEYAGLKGADVKPVKVFALAVYLRYLDMQKKSSTKEHGVIPHPELYRQKNRVMIRAWSLLGPTTNRTILILCALFARLDLYLWIVFLAGNCWLAVCYILQRRIHRDLRA